MTNLRSWPAALSFAFLLGTGCSGSDGKANPPGGGGGDEETGVLDPELSRTLADDLAAFDALSEEERLTAVNELDARVERELWRISGIDDELGGSEAADEAFAESLVGLSDYVTSIYDTDVALDVAMLDDGTSRAPATPNIGGALFGGVLINGFTPGAVIAQTNDGRSGTQDLGHGASIASERDRVSVTFDYPSPDDTPSGSSVTTRLSGKTELVVCPDADGQVTGKFTLDMSGVTTGGETGEKGTLSVEYVAQADDDAELVGIDITNRMQLARFRDQKGQFVDLTMRRGSGALEREFEARWNRSGGDVTPEFVKETAQLGAFLGTALSTLLSQEVEKGWKSGRCVEVQATPANRSVAPGATVAIEAKPRSRVDGAKTGGTVTATLEGESSLDPQGSKVKADAKFTYVAPGEANQSATVTLEARSKRGVGTASLVFSTAAGYVATGGGDMITITGEVASVSEPFQLTGTFPGGMAVFDYTPADAEGGTFVSALSGSGVTGSTEGTYTITPEDDGVLRLDQTGYGCIDGIAGSCRTQSEVITLTPK